MHNNQQETISAVTTTISKTLWPWVNSISKVNLVHNQGNSPNLLRELAGHPISHIFDQLQHVACDPPSGGCKLLYQLAECCNGLIVRFAVLANVDCDPLAVLDTFFTVSSN